MPLTLGVLFIVLPLVSRLPDEPVLDAYYDAWPLAALFVFWVVFGFFLLHRYIAWRMTPEQKDVRYSIDAQAVRVTDGLGASIIIPWTMVSAVRDTPKGFALRLKPRGVRWIPARAFDAQNAEAFRKLMQDKGF